MQASSGLLSHFHRYLLIGGFPELALLDDLTLSQKLLREDIVDKVLKRDMTAIYNIRNVNELEKLFIFLCLQSGNIITVQSLSRELGSSRPTVENYIKLLSMANMIYISDLVENTGKKALKSRPKAGYWRGNRKDKEIDVVVALPNGKKNPVIKIPAFVFLFLLGHAEREGYRGYN
jgi:predicted AAA+ superfamily ATPase